MKKVKVQRYISGKRPEYAPDSSDEEVTDDEDFTHPKGATHPPSPSHKMLTEVELQDPRLRRLRAASQMVSRKDENDVDADEGRPSRVLHKVGWFVSYLRTIKI